MNGVRVRGKRSVLGCPHPQPRSMPSLFRVALLVETSSSWGQGIIRGTHDWAHAHAPEWEFQLGWFGRNESVPLPEAGSCDAVIARVTSKAMAVGLQRLRVPVVNVSSPHWPSLDHCTWDDGAIGRMAQMHLHGRGLRRFAYVGPMVERLGDRMGDAFCAAAGATLAGRFQPDPAWSPSQMTCNLRAFLGGLPRPVGLLGWSAVEAGAVLAECRTQAWAVPSDISVIAGEEDALKCEVTRPALSSVGCTSFAVGVHAAQMLASRLADPDLPVREELIAPSGVRTRASTDHFAVGDALVARAQGLIHEQLHEAIRVMALATRLRVSRRTLEYRFRLALGHGPAEEIRIQKMEAARDRLATTRLSPKEIARTLGWSDEAAFRRVFTLTCSETPAAFRRRCGPSGA